MDRRRDPLQGILDKLILNATFRGPLHGYDWNRMTDAIAGFFATTSEEI
jgi:hypothetical protein